MRVRCPPPFAHREAGFRRPVPAPRAQLPSSAAQCWVAHIIQGRNPDEAWHHLLEQLEPFPLGVRVDRRQPGDVPTWTGEADRKPVPITSPTDAITMGIVLVAFRAATAEGVPLVTMTSTLRRTSSAVNAGKRSARPSADRYSMMRLRPSSYPRSRRPLRKASKLAALACGGIVSSIPMRLATCLRARRERPRGPR